MPSPHDASLDVLHVLGGALASRYEIVRCVQRRAHSGLFEARANGVPVALKIYALQGDPHPNCHARVLAEREALARVEHPCVARLLDAGAIGGRGLYLVSEWVEGRSFDALLRDRPLAWSELHPHVVDLARGLRAIHEASIVHRDVKPSNVMVGAQTTLIDFGHCLIRDRERITESGDVLGTAHYMAPEQAEGRRVDGRADLYSLGVLVYLALTGVLPFDHPSPALVMEMHRSAVLVPPRKRVEFPIDRRAEDLCMWLLAKQPSHRVPSARVLLQTLLALGAHEAR